MKGYFVTGTDTGVGKTYVTAAIARRARRAGRRVFAFKPVETGCDGTGPDQHALFDAAGGWQTGALRGVYGFGHPVAPRVAAESEGTRIDLDLIHRTLQAGAAEADLTLVEGAGGWRVPLTDTADIATLAQRCGLPVIIVARATLGTINHTLLTIEAVQRDGCPLAGVVLSRRLEEDLEFAESNRREILRRWPEDKKIVIYAKGNENVLDLFS